MVVIVPPANVGDVWGDVSELLDSVLRRGGRHTLESLKVELEAGKSQLWIVQGIKAVVVTTINIFPSKRVCLIWLCAGSGLREWLPLISVIESWAKGLGCSLVSIQGRPGWEKVLPEYEKTSIVLEKGI